MGNVILFGEPMALLTADTTGPLEEVEHFTRSMSGAEVNVAIGLTRLGHRAQYLTRLGDDPYAPYYRKGSAASHISPAEIDALDLTGIDLIHVTGIPPALSQSAREATFALMERAREAGIFLTFDPNLRPALWENEETMREVLNQMAAYADVVLPGIEECRILTGSDDPEEIFRFYQDLGVKMVIIKDGSRGALICTKTGIERVPGFKVETIVDTVGAGDGFAAGVLSGLLEEQPIRDCVRRGNAIGAIQVMSPGDNEGLPDREKLTAFMNA